MLNRSSFVAALKPVTFRVLASAGPAAWWRFRNRRAASILMFHGFCRRTAGGVFNSDGKHLQEAAFDAILGHLVSHYQIIPLADLVECLAERRDLPERAVVLTFDDGYASNYEIAFPLLKKRQASATIFLATEFVDENKPMWPDRVEFAFETTGRSSLLLGWDGFSGPRDLGSLHARISAMNLVKQWLKAQTRMENVAEKVRELEQALDVEGADISAREEYQSLSWDQVREMKDSGLVDFGAHTHTHRILGRLPEEVVRRELDTCTRIIERELGEAPRLFCYPNGKAGDFSGLTAGCLRDAGYRCALTTVEGSTRNGADVFALPRQGVVDGWSEDYFTLQSSGLLASFRALRS